jgi:hypothetical protein
LLVILDTPVILNGVKDHFVKRFFANAQNDGRFDQDDIIVCRMTDFIPTSRSAGLGRLHPMSAVGLPPSAADHTGRSGVAPLPARLRGTSTAKP